MYVLRNDLFKVLQKETAKCVVTTSIIALLGLSNHMDRNVQCLLLTARLGKVLATFKQKYACKFPCAYTLAKKKNSLIRNLCTTSALLYFSPMTQSIYVKSSSLSKSTNFYRNQPSEFSLREKEMLDSESSTRDVHWRLVLMAEGRAVPQCQLPVPHALHHWGTQVDETQNIS